MPSVSFSHCMCANIPKLHSQIRGKRHHLVTEVSILLSFNMILDVLNDWFSITVLIAQALQFPWGDAFHTGSTFHLLLPQIIICSFSTVFEIFWDFWFLRFFFFFWQEEDKFHSEFHFSEFSSIAFISSWFYVFFIFCGLPTGTSHS